MEDTGGLIRQARVRLADADAARRRGEVDTIRAVLQIVDLWPSPEPLPVDRASSHTQIVAPSSDRPGPDPASERTVPAGAEGAGVVGEFVALEVAATLGICDPMASMMVHDAVNLRARHPMMWAAVQELTLEVWQARKVVRACTELSAEAAGRIDATLARLWGTVGWSTISRRLPRLVVAADTALAARKARRARQERFVHIRHNGDSTSWLTARMDTGAALCLQNSIQRLTDQMIDEGATEELPLLRAQALELLATPYLPSSSEPANPSPPLPLADVVVHLDAADLDPARWSTGVAQVDCRGGDVGPVLLADVARLLGHHRVRVIPVIDQGADPATDGYRIPTRTRMQLQLREQTSIFPYSSRRSWSCDLDHTVPYRFSRPDSPAPPGQTRISNLGPVSRREHRAKTAGRWRLEQPAQGVYLWISPTGMRFAVVNGHTHRLADVGSVERGEPDVVSAC